MADVDTINPFLASSIAKTGSSTFLAGLPIYGQVDDEYTPWNEELYGFDEISKEKYHSECTRELFATTLGAS